MSEARDAYLALRDRARSIASSGVETNYVNTLWSTWDDVLAGYPPDTELPADCDSLAKVIADPRLDSDAVLEWLDAYPDGIIDRLPGGIFAPAVSV